MGWVGMKCPSTMHAISTFSLFMRELIKTYFCHVFGIKRILIKRMVTSLKEFKFILWLFYKTVFYLTCDGNLIPGLFKIAYGPKKKLCKTLKAESDFTFEISLVWSRLSTNKSCCRQIENTSSMEPYDLLSYSFRRLTLHQVWATVSLRLLPFLSTAQTLIRENYCYSCWREEARPSYI